MSGNVLTAVQPILYSAARVVPRELVGILGASAANFDDKGVAQGGDPVKISVVPTLNIGNVTPSQVFTAGNGRTMASKQLVLNQYKEVSWNLNAEEERSLLNGGVIANDILKQTVTQGFRTIINFIEQYVWQIAYAAASRAVGTAGTTPFAANFNEIAQVRQILDDNGAPIGDRSIVINTTAGVNLRNQPNLFLAYAAGTDKAVRQGVLLDVHGFAIRESAGVGLVTKGTGSLYTTSGTALPIGTTVIPLITGSGTVLAGDVVTFAGDTNKYQVTTGVAAPGSIVLAEPGIKVAIPAAATAMTIGGNFTANLAFDRNAIVPVVRPALQPDGMAFEQMVLTDPVTGFSVLLLRVPGSSMTSWYMRSVFDAFVPNPYALATILG